MSPDSRLAIAQVSPFAWEAGTEVNAHVSRVSEELSRRGHRVLVIAPSHSAALVRDTRRAVREGPERLLERADGEPLVLGVGEVLSFSPARRRAASLPIDVSRTIEEALAILPLDLVHVHEPFAPSASSAALRHSRALNVGTFHHPTERVLSTQLGRPLSQLLFARLDARLASYRATRDLVGRYFPGQYRVVAPGADPVAGERPGDGIVRVVMVAEEERAALRLFLRALRMLPTDPAWRVTVCSPRPRAAPATLSRALSERVEFLQGGETARAMAQADVLVLASEGVRTTPGVLARALASGIVPVAPRLPVYEELLSEGGRGLEFAPGDAQTLGSQLSRLIADAELRRHLSSASRESAEAFGYGRLIDELEGIYGELVDRRHDGRARPELRRTLRQRQLIDVDLHMHTDHSPDCATPVEVLLAEARARGLGAIAVTDHNEISGALEARTKAEGSGLRVIVGEEVKTAEQGEVIGLFLEQKIPRGMTLQETISEIRRQGGVVYVPHPFDRLHSVPDYQHLLPVLDEIDAIEVFNPRVAISEFNEEAARFAAKYRIPAGAGSDAHVPQGLGSVRIRMRDFSGPEEFLESLRDADIVRNPASLLYVQALKFLQTKALPEAARRASRDRRVRRAARNS
ncbi:MAG TPA: CehA/McbA family metallohydrolase [Solirubrobacteraceae bacterium]|nr:CehA/McbA family metallohydrolase [Solirubrobacteraceae bacterium]